MYPGPLATSNMEPFAGTRPGFGRVLYFKDTYREKAMSNKTPALTKSTNMDIWAVGTSNQLFMKGS